MVAGQTFIAPSSIVCHGLYATDDVMPSGVRTRSWAAMARRKASWSAVRILPPGQRPVTELERPGRRFRPGDQAQLQTSRAFACPGRYQSTPDGRWLRPAPDRAHPLVRTCGNPRRIALREPREAAVVSGATAGPAGAEDESGVAVVAAGGARVGVAHGVLDVFEGHTGFPGPGSERMP